MAPGVAMSTCNQIYSTKTWKNVYKIKIKPVKNKFHPPLKLCINNTPPTVIEKLPIEPIKGHGLGSTK